MDTAVRLARLRERIAAAGADGAIITTRENVAYLTGFGGSAGTLVIAPGRNFLLTDGRYDVRARAEASGVAVTIGKSLPEVINALPGRPVLLYEANNITAARLNELLAGVRRARLEPDDALVLSLRAVKDETEERLIRKACETADRAWADLQEAIQPGVSERALADRLEQLMRDHGARDRAFDSIVASGPNSAIPHHETGTRLLREGDFVVFDFGAKYDSHVSDMTRTVLLGDPTEQQSEVYEAVYRALAEATAMLAPGVAGSDVAEKAREVIREAGYEKRFTHGLGHGIGRDVHEQPGVGAGTTFQPGHIVTIEPGIYIEGWGGVRIEDDVLITDDGHEVLTRSPKPPRPSPPGWQPDEGQT